MRLEVRNPKTVPASLPDFTGKAALAEMSVGTTLSYRPNGYGAMRAGLTIAVDGRSWTVLSVAESEAVRGVRTLTLAEAG